MAGLDKNDYQIGWICALSTEVEAARTMLDGAMLDGVQSRDTNAYTLGRKGKHNVVLAHTPAGIQSAEIAATAMSGTFPNFKFGLVAGIGGGVPSSSQHNVRLGDVVVSKPTMSYNGVIQYDLGRTTNGQSMLGHDVRTWAVRNSRSRRASEMDMVSSPSATPSSAQTTIKSTSCESQSILRKVVPGIIGGRAISAFPDTGATLNAINYDFAIRSGFHIKPTDITVRLMNGKLVRPAGVVRLPFAFAGEGDQRYMLEFMAMRRLPGIAVLGSPFVHAMGLLTTNRHRLTNQIFGRADTFSGAGALLTEEAGRNLAVFHGRLAGADVSPLADSGSDHNIMSLSWATAHELRPDQTRSTRIRLANGDFVATLGTVTAPWLFDGEQTRPTHGEDHRELSFHVLEQCYHDIVLGQDIVYGEGSDKIDFGAICEWEPHREDVSDFAGEHSLNTMHESFSSATRRKFRKIRQRIFGSRPNQPEAPTISDSSFDAEVEREIETRHEIEDHSWRDPGHVLSADELECLRQERRQREEQLRRQQWRRKPPDTSSTAPSTLTRSCQSTSSTTPSASNPSLSNPNRSILN